MIYRTPFPVNAGGIIGIQYRTPSSALSVATINGYHEPKPNTLQAWQKIPWSGVEYNLGLARLLMEAIRCFSVDRLARIHQLDKKSHPFLPYQFPFPMRRFGHSCDVAALHYLLMMKHETHFTEREIRSGVIASLLHDLLTAAGGEKTKIQNLQLFDEDANFAGFLAGPEWQCFAQAYELDTPFVHDVILEANLAGEFKDIADKIAYTVRDSHALLSLLKAAGVQELGEYNRVLDLLADHADIGEIWQDVAVVGGKVVFTDAYALARFLRLRALMFDLVYQNTHTRRAAYIFSEVITRHLFDTGVLTRDAMLAKDDSDLDRLLDDYIQFDPVQDDPLWRDFDSRRSEAESFERQLIADGIVFSVVEDLSHAPKPGTQFPVMTPGGPRPLRDILTQEASEIEEICRHARWIKVGWLPHPRCEMRPGLHRDLQHTRQRRYSRAS